MAEEEFVSPMAAASINPKGIPLIDDLFLSECPIQDPLSTATSDAQDGVVTSCLPLLAAEDESLTYNDYGVPHLDRQRHIKFLQKSLGKLPGPYVAADASRPWMFYWCLNGISLLGGDVAPFRENLIETARYMQNESGGFGGGFGQLSHLATSYAMILALAIVGGESAFEVIDRRAMWKWICSLKQPDGGFAMCRGGEVDIRGAYCAAVIISLLDLPLDLSAESPAQSANLTDLWSGLAAWVRRCQTYEGGISAKPGADEAHGAYAFCALACLAILEAPHQIIPKYLDVPRLISWLSSRQNAPEGGFSGRTNKLVDGCYSHWVGGCWPLIEASLQVPESNPHLSPATASLYHREGLIRYILCCGQDQTRKGGMRDKPGRPSDSYHTCYVLNGLSSAQHKTEIPPAGHGVDMSCTFTPYLEGLQVFDEQDRVNTTDPIYAISPESRQSISSYFVAKSGF